MSTTVSYNATMCTRKATSSGNYLSSAASQEFYTNDYNFVGIIHFAGMNLTNKIITAISLSVTSAKAGYGAGSTKTVYIRKSNYQEASKSGITGGQYYGDALGTFTGSFFGNTTSYDFSGTLLTNLAAYFGSGNNTICLFNPGPTAGSQGYSRNYLQWNTCTITITYEEAASEPTVSTAGVAMGSAVTIRTNRLSTSATHTLKYSFGGASGTIATGVTDSTSWTPPLSLASQIPYATTGICTITCETYYGDTLTGSKTCDLTLTVPDSVVPTVSSISVTEATSGIAAQFGTFVQGKSKLFVSVSAAGARGSTVISCKAVFLGAVYQGLSFTTGAVNAGGNQILSVTITDTRGRSATVTKTISIASYAAPSLSLFTAERCNSAGTAAQMDGNKVRISIRATASSVSSKNTVSCKVYYKLTTATAWTQSVALTVSSYAVNETNRLLSQTFDALKSYDLKVVFSDYFSTVEQAVSIGTKQVMLDFYRDGTGVAFGKVAETSGMVEFGWPIRLTSPLGVAQGGTGANTADGACAGIGAVKKSGDTMTGNLNIQGSLYPSVYLLPTNNSTTNRTVFEGSYVGASSFASWNDGTGNNRRMLEVRNSAYESGIDNAVMVRTCDNGTWGNYRVFHAGMTTGVPIANGGTGATTAANARSNLGCNNAGNLTSGTIAAARLPFKLAYGSANCNGTTAAAIDYSAAGFTAVPYVIASYSTTSANWTGDNGALKIHSKTANGCSIIVGGSFSTKRNIDWIAIGV